MSAGKGQLVHVDGGLKADWTLPYPCGHCLPSTALPLLMLAQIPVSIASVHRQSDEDGACMGCNEGWQGAFASATCDSKSGLEQKLIRVMTY